MIAICYADWQICCYLKVESIAETMDSTGCSIVLAQDLPVSHGSVIFVVVLATKFLVVAVGFTIVGLSCFSFV